MSVTLRKRVNADGTTSLRLDIYHNGKRWPETLKNLKLITKPTNPDERKQNKENLELAKKIVHERSQQLEAGEHAITTNSGKKILVTEWMQSFVDSYKKKDKRNMQGALNRFKNFILDENIKELSFPGLSELLIEKFQEYLCEHSVGEGAASYFARFKKMLKRAKQEKIIKYNPAADVKTKTATARKKHILTLEEIQLLVKTPIQNPEIKRAAIYSLVTGLRWIDIKQLDWKDIEGKMMTISQTKTKKDVHINLNDTAIKVLGKRGTGKVFHLPSSNGANKTLKAWVKRAGITKEIQGWHNLRHSFGTNLIYKDVDVLTASKLLGHSSLKHTQRYVDIATQMKETATDKLNIDV